MTPYRPSLVSFGFGFRNLLGAAKCTLLFWPGTYRQPWQRANIAPGAQDGPWKSAVCGFAIKRGRNLLQHSESYKTNVFSETVEVQVSWFIGWFPGLSVTGAGCLDRAESKRS